MTTPMTEKEIERFEAMANGEGPLPYSALRRACDDLKMARSMNYPTDWWARVMKSGLYDRIMARIDGRASKPHLHTEEATEFLPGGRYNP